MRSARAHANVFYMETSHHPVTTVETSDERILACLHCGLQIWITRETVRLPSRGIPAMNLFADSHEVAA